MPSTWTRSVTSAACQSTRAGVQPGQSALVLGAGPIGIGVTLGLMALGVDDIVVVEPAPARRAAVEALGVEHVVDPGAVDVADEVRRRTEGRGVDAAIDCAGAAATFSVAPAVLRPRGRYVILAFGFIDVPFAPWLLARSEIELTGSCGDNSAVFDRVIELIDGGAYPTDGWVEHVGLDDVTRVLAELRAGERMKVLVDLA
jgi:(R,R)-butanediol dehydrogenase/meso-butanediol dehydrogenase/diacetyl reductase